MKQTTFPRLIFLSPSEIIPPRLTTADNDRYRLLLLSESIREHGLLVPVTVCCTDYGYEVISGERRIKASILAGLERIPCIVSGFKGDPELFRAAECLLGQERDALSEADKLSDLCNKYSFAQVASLLSFTTGELVKLTEITSLSSENRQKARESHLSLFQLTRLCEAERKGEEAKALEVESREAEKPAVKRQEKKLPPIKDARFLINSVKQLTESLCSAGIPIRFKQRETDTEVEIRINIKKNTVTPQMSLF